MHSKIKAVLFDLDDTLFDRQRTQAALLEVILNELPELFAGIERQKIGNAFFVSDLKSIAVFETGAPQDVVRLTRARTFLEMLDLSPEHAQKIAELYIHHYPLVGRAMVGARSALTELSRHYPLGLVSNGFADTQRRKLAALDLTHLFKCLVLSGEVGSRKPHPEIFQHAARLLDYSPRACLFVGNSYDHDIVGARTAGMQTCWYNPEGTRLLPGKSRPDFEIGALSAIAKLVLKV